jgi:hypothetical protein
MQSKNSGGAAAVEVDAWNPMLGVGTRVQGQAIIYSIYGGEEKKKT